MMFLNRRWGYFSLLSLSTNKHNLSFIHSTETECVSRERERGKPHSFKLSNTNATAIIPFPSFPDDKTIATLSALEFNSECHKPSAPSQPNPYSLIFSIISMRLSILQPHPHRCHYPIKRWPRMDASFHRRKDKVVVIMGATGSGKSRLSIDLATLFPSSEIINSDKMQVYRGLDITTNKIPHAQRRGVPHHLLGDVDPELGEFSPADFRRRASDLIADITRRRSLPIVVGGSNSFVHALLVQSFDPHSNVFNHQEQEGLISSELRYRCCFLWVDTAFPVLSQYLRDRVDDMLHSGMAEELAQFFNPEAASRTALGLRKAIGVPEFDRFFNKYPPSPGPTGPAQDPLRERAYEEAVRAIKDNTCDLAERQIGKIERLKRAGWELRRIDATEAFRGLLTSGSNNGSDVWERQVLEPSVKIVKRFLME